MRGFRFDEVMTGWHIFEPGFGPDTEKAVDVKRFMEFSVTWGPDNMMKWLNPFGEFMTQPLHGVITIDGLCENVQCKGTLELAYHKGLIRYTIVFEHNGVRYKYVGEKVNIRPWNLHITHTTCFGTLTMRTFYGDVIVSKSITFFRLRTLPTFLKSFRIV